MDRAQKDQDRLQDELEFTCKGMVNASKEFTNCWALHNTACANVNNTNANWVATSEKSVTAVRPDEAGWTEIKKASQRTAVLKRKATEAHEQMSSHRKAFQESYHPTQSRNATDCLGLNLR